MRVEWNGGKLTKTRAAFLCWKMWEWVAENITQKIINNEKLTITGNESFKWGWPEWEDSGGKVKRMNHYCAACEECKDECDACFLLFLWGEGEAGLPCYNDDSPFDKFCHAKTVRTARKYARIIAEAAKKKYYQYKR